jgi:hypothetical protein
MRRAIICGYAQNTIQNMILACLSCHQMTGQFRQLIELAEGPSPEGGIDTTRLREITSKASHEREFAAGRLLVERLFFE